jgi:hypothetical protein
MEFDELSNRVIAGILMNFNVTKLKSGIKCFVLLLRGETNLYLCESLVTLSLDPLKTRKSKENGPPRCERSRW